MPNMQIAWTVVFTGLVVVFILLIFLVYLVKGYGSVVSRLQGKTKEDEIAPVSRPAEKPAPFVEEGIPGEVVAAIAAAVSCLYGEAPRSVVSVRRARAAGRSAWEMAGLLENTRPF